MKRKINPSDGEGEGETTEENNNSRPDASGSEQVKIQIQRQRQKQKQRQRRKWIRTGENTKTVTETETETEMRVDPKRCKICLLPFVTFTQEQSFYFLKETFPQEQSQEEDAKDCTGQISKPVSQDLSRISN